MNISQIISTSITLVASTLLGTGAYVLTYDYAAYRDIFCGITTVVTIYVMHIITQSMVGSTLRK